MHEAIKVLSDTKFRYIQIDVEGNITALRFSYKGKVYSFSPDGLFVEEDLVRGVVSDDKTAFKEEPTIENFKAILPDELIRNFDLIKVNAVKVFFAHKKGCVDGAEQMLLSVKDCIEKLVPKKAD